MSHNLSNCILLRPNGARNSRKFFTLAPTVILVEQHAGTRWLRHNRRPSHTNHQNRAPSATAFVSKWLGFLSSLLLFLNPLFFACLRRDSITIRRQISLPLTTPKPQTNQTTQQKHIRSFCGVVID